MSTPIPCPPENGAPDHIGGAETGSRQAGATARAATLLGGRVAYGQSAAGHRSGIEPVLLAAAVPARAGEHVLEGGAGAGAGLLCLLVRVAGTRATGVDADPVAVGLARRNIEANGLADRAAMAHAVLPALPDAPRAVDHAFANPPWFDPASTPSPDPGRRRARVLPDGALPLWCGALGARVRTGGTLTIVVPASRHQDASAAIAGAGFGAIVLLPLWPKAGRAAKLLILRGRKGARGGGRVAPGLLLHGHDGCYTEAAEAVLRHGSRFPDGE